MFVLKNVKFFILIEFDFLKIIGTYAISHVASEVETNAESSGTELSRKSKDEIQLNLELGELVFEVESLREENSQLIVGNTSVSEYSHIDTDMDAQ